MSKYLRPINNGENILVRPLPLNEESSEFPISDKYEREYKQTIRDAIPGAEVGDVDYDQKIVEIEI